MSKRAKIITSILVTIALIFSIGVPGYGIYVNRRIKSIEVSDLKDYKDFAEDAEVLNAKNQPSTKLTNGKFSAGITVP